MITVALLFIVVCLLSNAGPRQQNLSQKTLEKRGKMKNTKNNLYNHKLEF